MTRAARLVALVALLGCSDLTDAGAGIVGVEVTAPFPATLPLGDSVQFTARALDKSGNSVATTITWGTPDTTIISVNSTTGLVTGIGVGLGRVQAISGAIASALVTITVTDTTTTTPTGAVRRPR